MTGTTRLVEPGDLEGMLRLTALWALFGGPSLGIDPTRQRPNLLARFAGMLVIPVQVLRVRAFLRREIPKRYPGITPDGRP